MHQVKKRKPSLPLLQPSWQEKILQGEYGVHIAKKNIILQLSTQREVDFSLPTLDKGPVAKRGWLIFRQVVRAQEMMLLSLIYY